jgi:hypothetical protein
VPLLGAFPVRTLLQGEGGAGSTSAGVSVGKELGTLEWAGASGAAPTQRGALCGAVGGFRREGELHRNLASWEQVDRTESPPPAMSGSSSSRGGSARGRLPEWHLGLSSRGEPPARTPGELVSAGRRGGRLGENPARPVPPARTAGSSRSPPGGTVAKRAAPAWSLDCFS